MTQPAQGADLTSHRRDRLVAALERLDGVVAANVEFDRHGAVETVRIAAMDGADDGRLRQRLHERLRELDIDVTEHALTIAWMGRTAAAPDPFPPTAPSAASERNDQGEAPSSPPLPEPPAPPEPQAPPPPWHGRFLVLDGVDVERREHRVSCTVRITRLGEAFSATVEEIDSPAGRARAAARATLRAAEQAGEGVRLSLEGIVLREFFGREYVAAFVEATANRRFAALSGILAVEQSLETAAALSILRAVERWVAW